ncbi:cytochrome P450 82A3 [Trifolium repens]|nr:cytochrome P450 82A3 [Trifolium repens]
MDLVLSSLINTTPIALLISLIPLLLFLFGFTKFANRKNKEAPIAKGAWPILGHLPIFSGTQPPHRVLGTLADKYGPIFTIKLGSKHALIINNWEMAKECFTTNDMAVSSRPKLVATEHLAYKGAMFGFAPYGPYWRQLRKIATLEILSNRRVEQAKHVHISEVRTSIKELCDVWSSKKSELGSSNYVLVDMKEWFTHLTFNMVLRMVVGKRYFGVETNVEEEEAQRCVQALKELMHLFGIITVGDVIPSLKLFDFGGHVKAMNGTSKRLDKILGEWLKERRHNKILGENINGQNQDILDVLLLLFDGRTIEGFDSDTVIKATILTLFAGGTDTSSVILIWALSNFLHSFDILNPTPELVDMTEEFGLTNTKATPLKILVKPRLSLSCYEIV